MIPGVNSPIATVRPNPPRIPQATKSNGKMGRFPERHTFHIIQDKPGIGGHTEGKDAGDNLKDQDEQWSGRAEIGRAKSE